MVRGDWGPTPAIASDTRAADASPRGVEAIRGEPTTAGADVRCREGRPTRSGGRAGNAAGPPPVSACHWPPCRPAVCPGRRGCSCLPGSDARLLPLEPATEPKAGLPPMPRLAPATAASLVAPSPPPPPADSGTLRAASEGKLGRTSKSRGAKRCGRACAAVGLPCKLARSCGASGEAATELEWLPSPEARSCCG
jgi:hypothetical protein